MKKPLIFSLGFTLILLSCTPSPENQEIASIPFPRSKDWTVFRGNPGLTGWVQEDIKLPLTLLWSATSKGQILSTPVIYKNQIYLARESGVLEVFNLVSGNILWQVDLKESMEASPFLLENHLILATLEGTVVALNPETGEEIWRIQLPGRLSGSPNGVKIQEDLFIFLGCYDHFLYGLNGKTGAVIWKYKTKSYINGTPALVGNSSLVFGGCDGQIHRLKALTGEEIQSYSFDSYLAGSPGVWQNQVYFGVYSGTILGLDLGKDSPLWSQSLKDSPPFVSSPALSQTQVIASARDNQVYALDRLTGKLLWSFTTGDEVDSSPLIMGNHVFFGSTDGFLYILDTLTGTKVWEFNAGEAFLGSPAYSQGMVVIGGREGTLFVFSFPSKEGLEK